MAFRDTKLAELKSSQEKKATEKFTSLVTHPDIAKNILFEFLGMKELANLSAVSKTTENSVTTYVTKTSISKSTQANVWQQLAVALEHIAKELKFSGKETLDAMEPMLNTLTKTPQSNSQRWDIIKVDMLLNIIQEPLITALEAARTLFEKCKQDKPGQVDLYEFYLRLSQSIPLYIWSLVAAFKLMKQSQQKPNTPLNEKLINLLAYFSQQQEIIFKHWICLFIKDPQTAKNKWPSHLHFESGIDQTMLFGRQDVYQDIEKDIPTHEHQFNALSFAAHHNLVDLARYLIIKKRCAS